MKKRNTPYSQLALLLFISVVCVVILISDRNRVLDNDNYIRYFSDPDQLKRFFEDFSEKNLLQGAALLISDELIWQLYSGSASYLNTPNFFIIFTTLAINTIVPYSIWRSGGGLIGCVLWSTLPVCMAVIGFFQIRQGLAVLVFFVGTMYSRRLLTLALIASMIHTTFLIPVVILLFEKIPQLQQKSITRHVVMFICFAGVCFIAGGLFGEFGGRRASTYEADDGAGSLNFIVGTAILSIPSLMVVLREPNWSNRIVRAMARLHIGLGLWLVAAFILFPLGTSRVGYYAQIFSIIPAGAVLQKRDITSRCGGLLYLLMAIALIYGGVRDGTYSQLLQ